MNRYLWSLILFSGIVGLCTTAEPECPFGSPKVELADVDGRCDRFWLCEDGLISDMFCPSGQGFNDDLKKCDSQAPCLKDGSSTSPNRSPDLKRIADILVPKPVREAFSKGNGRAFNGDFSSAIAPLVSPIIKLFAFRN